jgi:hypothetical protein
MRKGGQVFNYYGAKRRLVGNYPPPIFSTIIEPFAGSAAYAVRHRSTASTVILYEKDRRVVDLWHRLLDTSAADLLAAPTPLVGSMSSDLLMAFASARTTRDTPATFQVSARMIQRHEIMVRRIAAVIDDCRHFDVRFGDYSDAPDIEATWFIDPPYQQIDPLARWDRTRGGRYLHSNRNLDYDALGRWASSRRGQVIACEQDGATWLDWNASVAARNSDVKPYREVFWHRLPAASDSERRCKWCHPVGGGLATCSACDAAMAEEFLQDELCSQHSDF